MEQYQELKKNFTEVVEDLNTDFAELDLLKSDVISEKEFQENAGFYIWKFCERIFKNEDKFPREVPTSREYQLQYLEEAKKLFESFAGISLSHISAENIVKGKVLEICTLFGIIHNYYVENKSYENGNRNNFDEYLIDSSSDEENISSYNGNANVLKYKENENLDKKMKLPKKDGKLFKPKRKAQIKKSNLKNKAGNKDPKNAGKKIKHFKRKKLTNRHKVADENGSDISFKQINALKKERLSSHQVLKTRLFLLQQERFKKELEILMKGSKRNRELWNQIAKNRYICKENHSMKHLIINTEKALKEKIRKVKREIENRKTSIKNFMLDRERMANEEERNQKAIKSRVSSELKVFRDKVVKDYIRNEQKKQRELIENMRTIDQNYKDVLLNGRLSPRNY